VGCWNAVQQDFDCFTRGRDFPSVLKDLEQIEEVSEQIAIWAKEFGNKEVTAGLVRLCTKAQASSEAAPGQRRKKHS
jgi:hypothetical protein